MGKIKSDKEIQAIKARDVQQKISDGDGLFLIVQCWYAMNITQKT